METDGDCLAEPGLLKHITHYQHVEEVDHEVCNDDVAKNLHGWCPKLLEQADGEQNQDTAHHGEAGPHICDDCIMVTLIHCTDDGQSLSCVE